MLHYLYGLQQFLKINSQRQKTPVDFFPDPSLREKEYICDKNLAFFLVGMSVYVILCVLKELDSVSIFADEEIKDQTDAVIFTQCHSNHTAARKVTFKTIQLQSILSQPPYLMGSAEISYNQIPLNISFESVNRYSMSNCQT